MSNQLEKYKGKLIFTSEEEIVDNSTYKTLISVINIDKKMFHSIYPGFYPKKGLSNQIGAAMGIEFTSNIKIEDVYGDIVEMPDGSKIKKPAGIRCVKQGKRRRPDGTWQLSSPCSYVFNWNDRAELDILADAEKTSGQKYHFPNNPAKQTREQRKHILELKKFADQRASTGSELQIIRELTGMETSFKADDIAKGQIVVSQIIRSEAFQKELAKAKIDDIRLGGKTANVINDAALMLTGTTVDVSQGFDNKFDRPQDNKKSTTMEASTINHKEDIPNPDNKSGELSLKETFENLLKDETVIAQEGVVEHFTKAATDNNFSDAVLTWAIGEITGLIDGGSQ